MKYLAFFNITLLSPLLYNLTSVKHYNTIFFMKIVSHFWVNRNVSFIPGVFQGSFRGQIFYFLQKLSLTRSTKYPFLPNFKSLLACTVLELPCPQTDAHVDQWLKTIFFRIRRAESSDVVSRRVLILVAFLTSKQKNITVCTWTFSILEKNLEDLRVWITAN